MGLETFGDINDLVPTNPVDTTDTVASMAAHIRGLKSTLQTDFPGVTGPVTSSHTELNILDGVTAITSEFNVLDDSAQAVSNYVNGVRTYVHADSGDATLLDVDGGVTTATWTSIGPTGAGADVTWTALDSVPSGSNYVTVGLRHKISGSSSGVYQGIVYSRVGGSATGIGSKSVISEISFTNTSAGAEELTTQQHVNIPIDSNGIFDLYWVEVGTSPTSLIDFIMKGFG